MKKTLFLYSITFCAVFPIFTFAQKPLYKNPEAAIEERVEDLLGRMTLEEKVAQLGSTGNLEVENGIIMQRDGLRNGLGQLSRTGEKLLPKQTVQLVNALQHFLMDSTRLGIPAIIHEETLHGVMMAGATVFPQAIARGSSWNVDLERKVGEVIARETRSRGSNLSLSPNLDLARDPRYGRTEETYGEDPYLASRMGVAIISGMQGDTYNIGKDHIGVTVKHLGASGQPLGGLNLSPNYMSERTMREADFVPFRAAVEEAKVASVMAAYVEYDGQPCHSNQWLLDDLLRREWGFEGIVVSDYGGIGTIAHSHHCAEDMDEAALLALNAGVDVELARTNAYKNLVKLVHDGRLEEKSIDRAVKRVLRLKFRLGLFENPYADENYAMKNNRSAENLLLSLNMARESVVLLKNKQGILPLNLDKYKDIAVIGPNAAHAHYGGYTTEWSYDKGISILDGLQKVLSELNQICSIKYAEGCKIHSDDGYWRHPEPAFYDEDKDHELICEAMEVAGQSDIVILALGGTPRTCRESAGMKRLGDRNDLCLYGRQQELFDSLCTLGKPIIVYLMNGRPLTINRIAAEADAILEGWYLGEATGKAVAEVLLGKVNPSGKLPVSFPRSVGNLPAYYNRHPSAFGLRYINADNEPLYPFGFGLSYTTFEYGKPKLSTKEMTVDGSVLLSVKVKNTGFVEGKEVVQLYVRDDLSTVTRPIKELKGFKKIFLKPGEEQIVRFTVDRTTLKYFNRKMQEVVEPGTFTLMVGPNSTDLQDIKFIVK